MNTPEKDKDLLDYIKFVWRYMPKSDRYSFHQFFLWAKNERPAAEKLSSLSQKYYKNDYDERIETDIENTLEKLENDKNKKLLHKINTTDPLFLLKSIVKGKTWEGAKQSLYHSSLGGWAYKGGSIKDDEANEAFNRLYKNTMGITHYDLEHYPYAKKLSTLENTTDPNKRDEAIIVHQYVGYTAIRFPDKIRVYRGVNSPSAKVRPGDFVTFDRDYASSYKRGKFGAVISAILPSNDLYMIKFDTGRTELLYWPAGTALKHTIDSIPSFKKFWIDNH